MLVTGIQHNACGHPADQSAMRVRVEPHRLEVRLTFNLLTLTKFIRVDADGDGKLAFEELQSAQPALVDYLNKHLKLELNQRPVGWGNAARVDLLWPSPESTPPMSVTEYEGRNMDVTFELAVMPLLEDFWIGFEIFEHTGPMQTILGLYEQDGRLLDVPFSMQEPEYTYDTGYTNEVPDPPAESASVEKPVPLLENSKRAWWWLAAPALVILAMLRRPQKKRGGSGD